MGGWFPVDYNDLVPHQHNQKMRTGGHYSPRFLLHIDEIPGHPFATPTAASGTPQDMVHIDDRYFTTLWHEYVHYLFTLTPAGMGLFTYRVIELLKSKSGFRTMSWWPELQPRNNLSADGRRRLVKIEKIHYNHKTEEWWAAGQTINPFGIKKEWKRPIGFLDVIEGLSEISIDFLPGYYRDATPGCGRPQETRYVLLRKIGEFYDWPAKDVFRLAWESLFEKKSLDPVDHICRTLSRDDRKEPSNRPPSKSRRICGPVTCEIEELKVFLEAVECMQLELKALGRRIISYEGLSKDEFDRDCIKLLHTFPLPPIFLEPEKRITVLSPVDTKWDALKVHRILSAIPVITSLYPKLSPCPFFGDGHALAAGLQCPNSCSEGNWTQHDLENADCLLGTILRHYKSPYAKTSFG
jgi:hypothetical protein